MDINIIKGDINYIDDCEEAVVNSELGRRYFSELGSALKSLEEGFNEHDVYLAIDEIPSLYRNGISEYLMMKVRE